MDGGAWALWMWTLEPHCLNSTFGSVTYSLYDLEQVI